MRWRLAVSALVPTLVLALIPRLASAEEVFATVERTVAPGERAIVRVRSDAQGPVLLVTFRVEDAAALIDSGVDMTHGEATYAQLGIEIDTALKAGGPRAPAPFPREVLLGVRPKVNPIRLTFVGTTTAVLEKPAGGAGEPTKDIEVPLPASGLYVVEVRREKVATLVTALSSRIALVTKRDPKGCLAWAVDRTTGRALEGVDVAARAAGKELAAGKTNADGLARLDFAGSPTVEMRATSADDLAFGSETYSPADVSDRRVYAFPHQPAYRPGERVEVKGIVRAWQDGHYALDSTAREAVLRFLASGEKELGRMTVPVSADLGTFAGGFDLPKDAPLGACALVADVGGKSYEAPFRIEEYRKPTFEVLVAPAAPRVLAGGAMSFDVSASFYEGGPVAGGEATWSLVWNRVDRDLFPTDELVRLFFGTEREAYAPEVLTEGKVKLDAAGKAHLEAKAPLTKEDGWLTLRATVIGPDRTAVAGSGGLAVAASPISVALKTDKHLYGTEGVAHVLVKVVKADGTPAAGREGVVTAAISNESNGAPPEERETESAPFTTGADGAAAVAIPFSVNGRYAISAAVPRAKDEPDGPPAHAALHVWSIGEHADVGYSGDRLEIVADKDSYAVGETAQLLLVSPIGLRPSLTTTEGARILSQAVLQMAGKEGSGGAAHWSILIADDHAPNVYVAACVVDHGNLLATSKLLRVPPARRLLRTEILPEKPELDPGASMGLSMRVMDSDGKPAVGAEVSVSVVDDSLFALYSDPAAAIEPFFYPLRRNDVRTGGPLHLECVGFDRFSPPEPAKTAGPAPGSAAEPPRGDAGGAPPAPASPPAASPVPETGSGGGGGGAPRPVEPGRMSCGAGKCGGADGAVVGLLRRLGDGGKADEESGDVEGPLDARADFRTAVWWSPAVRTGADGTATIGPVKFADSLTRWRITARAVDADTRVGTAITTVKTAKKLMTRVTLPRFLRVNDTVEAPWMLHSLLTESTKADYVASATGLQIRGEFQGSEELAAGAVVAHDLKIAAPAPGVGTLTAELRSPAGSDAERQSIPMLPQGIPKAVSAFAFVEAAGGSLSLALPSHAEPGTARLKITVAPSYAQAVGAALPYLLDYPYGCTEQTMSRLVPCVVAKIATDSFHVPLKGRLAELPRMIDAGLSRLRTLQHDDGGFGWWEKDASDAYMTAYVLHGLTRAMLVMPDPAPAKAMADRAAAWLDKQFAASSFGDQTLNAFAFMALADSGRAGETDRRTMQSAPPGYRLAQAFELKANVSMHSDAMVAMLVKALTEAAARDGEGVHWDNRKDGSEGPSRWMDDPVETTAWVLSALLAADPKHADLTPGARWLLAHRANGDHWNSTRDTSVCVAFLTRYAAVTGDLGAGKSVRVVMNGQRLADVVVTPETAFTDAAVLEVADDALPKGPIEITATPSAGGAAISATLSFTETGPAIGAASSGFDVRRTWYRLDPVTKDGKVTYTRTPFTEAIPTGTLVEVEVAVATDKPREFVMVTSPHAAGFEPERDVALPIFDSKQGGRAPAPEADHVETRDDRTVFFAKAMPAGTAIFRHRMRATHVGGFTALPAQAELMYFPDVRGNATGEAMQITKGGGR